MKRNKDNTAFLFKSIGNTASALRNGLPLFAVKENFTSDIFRLLKTSNEKLPIIYANIRV